MAKPKSPVSGRSAGPRAVPSSKKGTGGRLAYEAVREKILSLELQPGQDLDEAELVKQLNVSRTPLREAFIRLATERLVVILPNRGARVAEISLTSTREFFEALSLVQRAVTRWAAIRATADDLVEIRRCMLAFEQAVARCDGLAMATSNRDFHVSIGRAARNSHFAQMNSQLLDEGMRLSQMAVIYDPAGAPSRADHLNVIIGEHRAIVAAIETGMEDRAEELGMSHANLFRRRIMDFTLETADGPIRIDAR